MMGTKRPRDGAVLSAQTIKRLALVAPMMDAGRDENGNSFGLGPCGYDVRIAENVSVPPNSTLMLASTLERFDLPANVVGVVHDKSSLARRGLAVQNTVLEPGWRGFLTLELTNHGPQPVTLARGCAVAQVVFAFLDEPTERPYRGKYQDQEAGPQAARVAAYEASTEGFQKLVRDVVRGGTADDRATRRSSEASAEMRAARSWYDEMVKRRTLSGPFASMMDANVASGIRHTGNLLARVEFLEQELRDAKKIT